MKTGNKTYPYDSNGSTNQLHFDKFGTYDLITLKNESAGHEIQIIPELGGKINKLWLNGHQIIDGYLNYDDLKNDTYYHNVFLFPFVNRLAKGQYRFNDNDYQFPMNEPQTGNALHGFLYNEPVELIDYDISD